MSAQSNHADPAMAAVSENAERDPGIAADLAYDRMKSDGTLHRMEAHRALVAQVNFGDAL